MEIYSDEAYYYLYSKHLAWGYFDHPPMVALMISLSAFLFEGNLGIRFITLLMQVFSLILIWMTWENRKTDNRNIYTFFIVAGSLFMFSGYGVITTPDAPLLFFTSLFLFSYRKFISSDKWQFTLLIAFAMAALVYSKYQAVLVIGFALISNLRLVKNPRFWIAGVLAILLVSPHFYWQFSHDFPSFQYHLSYRLEEFKLKNVVEYLPNQIILMNPFTFVAVLFVLIKFKPSGPFDRTLYFQIIGILIFFLLISFRDHVEPNWTIPYAIPIILILTDRISKDQWLFRYSRRIILPSILLVLAGRIVLINNNDISRLVGYNGKKEKYEFIESVAKDLPVVFVGSYQPPSLYQFFTGREAIVLSSPYSRLTQFDVWQFEKQWHNKPVFVSSVTDTRTKIYRRGHVHFHGFKTDSLQTVNRMKITYKTDQNSVLAGDSIKIDFSVKNTYDYTIDFNHRFFPVKVCLVLVTGKDKNGIMVLDVSLSKEINLIKEGQELQRTLTAQIPDLPNGRYKLAVCLNNALGPAFNSRFSDIYIGSALPETSRLTMQP